MKMPNQNNDFRQQRQNNQMQPWNWNPQGQQPIMGNPVQQPNIGMPMQQMPQMTNNRSPNPYTINYLPTNNQQPWNWK